VDGTHETDASFTPVQSVLRHYALVHMSIAASGIGRQKPPILRLAAQDRQTYRCASTATLVTFLQGSGKRTVGQFLPAVRCLHVEGTRQLDETGNYVDALDDDERELIRKHRESKGQPDDGGRADHEQHADSSRGSAKKKRTILIVSVAVVVLAGLGIGLGIGLGGSPGGSPTNGFYNMSTLAQSVQSSVQQAAINGGGPGYSDSTVTGCSMSGAHTAICILNNGAMGTGSVTVLISNDGSTWSQQ
jgi:hypothetical protein